MGLLFSSDCAVNRKKAHYFPVAFCFWVDARWDNWWYLNGNQSSCSIKQDLRFLSLNDLDSWVFDTLKMESSNYQMQTLLYLNNSTVWSGIALLAGLDKKCVSLLCVCQNTNKRDGLFLQSQGRGHSRERGWRWMTALSVRKALGLIWGKCHFFNETMKKTNC